MLTPMFISKYGRKGNSTLKDSLLLPPPPCVTHAQTRQCLEQSCFTHAGFQPLPLSGVSNTVNHHVSFYLILITPKEKFSAIPYKRNLMKFSHFHARIKVNKGEKRRLLSQKSEENSINPLFWKANFRTETLQVFWLHATSYWNSSTDTRRGI